LKKNKFSDFVTFLIHPAFMSITPLA